MSGYAVMRQRQRRVTRRGSPSFGVVKHKRPWEPLTWEEYLTVYKPQETTHRCPQA